MILVQHLEEKKLLKLIAHKELVEIRKRVREARCERTTKLSRLSSCDVNVKICIICSQGLGFTVNAVIPLKKSHMQQILTVSRQLISGDNFMGQETSPDRTLSECHSKSSFFLLCCHCTKIKPDNGRFKTVNGHLRTKENTNTSEVTQGDVEYDIKFDLGEQSLYGKYPHPHFASFQTVRVVNIVHLIAVTL